MEPPQASESKKRSTVARPRQKSLETISVGLKWLRAKVDLPLPDTPNEDDQPHGGQEVADAVPLDVVAVRRRGPTIP